MRRLILLSAALACLAGDHPRDYFFFPPVVVPTPAPAPDPEPPPPMPRAAGPSKAPAAKAHTAADPDRIASVLGSCARCHSDPKPKGKTTLFNEAGAFTVPADRKAVYEAVKDDDMPRGGPPLSRGDKDLLRRWAGIPQETN